MNLKVPGMVAAALITAAVPAAVVFAQSQAPQRQPRLSADARAHLLDGRFAMAKTALNLTDAQLQLWAPVEQHIRASIADREKKRQERRQMRQSGATPPPRLSLPDRLDRASERMAQRAERMKAFAAVFKPFYASLNDEQKVVARVVLRQVRGGGMHGHGPRWASRQGPPPGGAARPENPQKQ
jgi:hypothetical protein